jgi:hypothetical protein
MIDRTSAASHLAAKGALMNRFLLDRPWLLLAACLVLYSGLHAEPVSQLQVRIVTGAADLTPGSYVELRIYETGGAVRKLPLTHGEGWPHDSTRTLSLSLAEPLDARQVLRFSLYYRAAHIASPPWSVVAADVDLAAGRGPEQLLLATTLSGEVHRQGEIASPVREASALLCFTDADCDDGRSCNGVERCAPRAAGADERGCVRGKPVACPVNQVCTEDRGCVGASAFAPTKASTPAAAAGDAPAAGAGGANSAPGASGASGAPGANGANGVVSAASAR